MFRVEVECYAGHRGEETPRCMLFEGRTVTIADVLDRWLAPDHRYFKVVGSDGATYILRHDVAKDIWEMVSFAAAPRD